MKLHTIPEPLLDFGRGTDVCPRAGITKYDVYDTRRQVRREKILVGGVGTSDSLIKLKGWIEKASRYIPAKNDNRLPNLYPAFCGFNRACGFKASLVYEDEITRSLSHSEIKRIAQISDWNERVEAAVELFSSQVHFLARHRAVDVIICIIPTSLYENIAKEQRKPIEETIEEKNQDDNVETNFRRLLKARTLYLGKPIQLMREVSLESNPKGQHDDATKAWNFCTALYYKANQTVPWRLITNSNRPLVCYVGVGFYRSRDREVLHTSLAQIFDELGNGLILRGTPVQVDKTDRHPYLTEDQAELLLERALQEYKIALGTSPGRLVMHKTSKYNSTELDGFKAAADKLQVGSVDFITILDSTMRLTRDGEYPPYRGTHVELDEQTHLLYTRGFVKHYGTYPGLYVPQPLEIRIVEADESPGVICSEILSLTKMNWNSTQFDGKFPITIECARNVGKILKYLDEHDQPQISYSFYM